MKNRKNNILIIFGIVFFIIIILCVYFNTKKEKEQKEQSEEKIKKQQWFVTYLLLEVAQFKRIQSKLICDAIKFYKRVRIFSVTIIVAFGFVCYSFYNLPLWASITGLLAFLAFVYYCYTLIKFNKFLDYNVALKKVETYFIVRKYRRNDFNPELIPIYEDTLKKESEVLNQLIENHKNKIYL